MSTNAVGVYRAIVSYVDENTGEIKVRIPSKFGPKRIVKISMVGRKPDSTSGLWAVPEIGEQVVVTADSADFSNVFILNVTPAT